MFWCQDQEISWQFLNAALDWITMILIQMFQIDQIWIVRALSEATYSIDIWRASYMTLYIWRNIKQYNKTKQTVSPIFIFTFF